MRAWGRGLRFELYGSGTDRRYFLEYPPVVGVRIRGTLGDIDPLDKVPFKRAISRLKAFEGSP